MTLHPTRFVLACLSFALLTSGFALPAWAQRTGQAPSPTRSLMRNAPSRFRAKPIPAGPQEPVRDDRDADAAAVFRPNEPIEPVDVVLSSGEVRLGRTDLFIRGRAGMDFELRRVYRSRLRYKGPLGHGWDLNYNEQLLNGPGGAKLRLNGAGHVDTWTRNPDGSFNSPPGFFGTLVEHLDGSFTLREPDGLKHHYLANGFLRTLEDRHGNRMTFNRVEKKLVSATDVFGRVIRFFYEPSPDGRRRLARVRDFTGREVVYTYDSSGDLVAARSPIVVGTSTGNDFPQGTTERYSYFAEHNLHEVTFPNEVAVGGAPAMVFHYDDQDRVTSWMLGGTNASGVPAGGTATFAYETLNAGEPLGQPGLARLRTTVVERNGNFLDVEVDELQHQVQHRRHTRGFRPGEPAFYLTRREHDLDGQLTRLIKPRGNGELRTYDSAGPRAAQSDLLERRRVADAVNLAGPDEDIVWTYAHDPVFHQRVSTTDPRESSPSFVPPIGSNAPGRYTTRRFVDYQEGTDPIPDAVAYGIDLGSFPRGLGDLNADGRTDQTAGNAVRREDPSVRLEAGSPLALELGSTTQEIVTETWWNDFGQRTGEIDPEGSLTTWEYHPESDPAGQAAGPMPPSLVDGGYHSTTVTDAADTYRRTTLADVLALMARVERNERGDVTARINPRGVREGYEVNELGSIVKTTRGEDVSQAPADQLPTGESAFSLEGKTFYDANGNPLFQLLENDPATAATPGVGAELESGTIYNILNQPIEEMQEVDATQTAMTTYAYDPSGHWTGVTYAEGNQDTLTRDERHLPWTWTEGAGSPEAGSWELDYDPNGHLNSCVDPLGNSTTYENDLFDRRTATNEPLGYSVRYAIDVTDNVTAKLTYGHPVGNPAGTPELYQEVHYSHDEMRRNYRTDELVFLAASTTTARPFDVGDGMRTTRDQYDAVDNLCYETDDLGRTSSWMYDGAWRWIGAMDPLGNAFHYDRDNNGNVVTIEEVEIQPEGMLANQMFTTTITYDQLDREVRRIDSGGSTSYTAWDSLGNIRETWDARGAVLPVDPWGIFPRPGQTGQSNDRGNSTRYAYDGQGLRLQATYSLHEQGEATLALDTSSPYNPDGVSTIRYDLDLNGRLLAMTDDVGNLTQWDHNSRDWITSRTLPTGGTFDFTHDLVGNVLTRSQPNGFSLGYTYDARYRPLTETRTAAPQTGGVISKTWSWSGIDRVYETESISNSFAPPPPSTTVATRTVHDSRGLLAEETVCGLVTSHTRNGAGSVCGFTYPDGRTVTSTLDALDRPMDLSDSINGAVITSRYRMGRERVLQTEYANGTMGMNAFDARRELIGVEYYAPPAFGGTVFMDNAYTRNRNGDLDSKTSTVGGPANIDYTAEVGSVGQLLGSDNTAGRLDYIRNGAQIVVDLDFTHFSGSFSRTHFTLNGLGAHRLVDGFDQFFDANGNQGEFYPTQYNYNHDDQVAYIVPLFFGSPKEFIYDANGRLAMTVELRFGEPFVRVYAHVDDRVVQEWQVVGETKTLLNTYLHLDGELVLMDNGVPNGTTLHHHGWRGTIAQTFLDTVANGSLTNVLVNYTALGKWDPIGNYGFTLGDYFLGNGWRFEPNFNVNSYGEVWDSQTGRLFSRRRHDPMSQPWPVAVGNLYEDGSRPGAFAPRLGQGWSGLAKYRFTIPRKTPLFEKKTFRIPRTEAIGGLTARTCTGTAVLGRSRQPSEEEFFQTLRENFTEVERPRVGDLIGYDFDEAGRQFSHFGIVVQTKDGRYGVIGKGRCTGPVELHDALDFGEDFTFFRRNGSQLDSATEAEIARQLDRALTLEGEAALRSADRLLFLGQELNALAPR